MMMLDKLAVVMLGKSETGSGSGGILVVCVALCVQI